MDFREKSLKPPLSAAGVRKRYVLKTIEEMTEAMNEGDSESVEYLASYLSRKEVNTNIGTDGVLREYIAALGLFRPQVKERKSKKQIREQALRFNCKFKG